MEQLLVRGANFFSFVACIWILIEILEVLIISQLWHPWGLNSLL